MLVEVLGDLLPPAVGIAISPVPIIAVILMLLSVDARKTAPAFAIGWLLGIAVVALVVMLLVPPSSGDSGSGTSTGVGWLKLLLGVFLIALAVRNWRKRPKAGETAELPKWMAGVDRMKPLAALGLGAALSAVNPKNLPLALAGGLSLATVDGGGQQAIGLLVFVLLAGATVLVPVVVYLAATEKMAPKLTELKEWLAQNNAVVMAVVLLVLGVTLLGKGLAGAAG